MSQGRRQEIKPRLEISRQENKSRQTYHNGVPSLAMQLFSARTGPTAFSVRGQQLCMTTGDLAMYLYVCNIVLYYCATKTDAKLHSQRACDIVIIDVHRI